MKSIRSRLILSMSISIFVVLGVIIGIVGYTVRNNTLNQAYSSVGCKQNIHQKRCSKWNLLWIFHERWRAVLKG